MALPERVLQSRFVQQPDRDHFPHSEVGSDTRNTTDRQADQTLLNLDLATRRNARSAHVATIRLTLPVKINNRRSARDADLSGDGDLTTPHPLGTQDDAYTGRPLARWTKTGAQAGNFAKAGRQPLADPDDRRSHSRHVEIRSRSVILVSGALPVREILA
jgi:hypothetical protein